MQAVRTQAARAQAEPRAQADGEEPQARQVVLGQVRAA
jgi:hypothetical protein